MSRPARHLVKSIAAIVMITTLAMNSARSQEADAPGSPLPEDDAQRLDQLYSDINLERQDIQALDERLAGSELNELAIVILNERRDLLWSEMIADLLRLADQLADHRDAGQDVSPYLETVLVELSALPEQARTAIDRLASRAVLPTGDLPPGEFVFKDQELFTATGRLDDIYESLIDFIEISGRFDIDAGAEIELWRSKMSDSAEYRSVFLEMARTDALQLRAAVTTLPDDTEMAAWLRASEARVQLAAKALQDIVGLMNAAGLETRMYRRQVLTVTGEITTDILDVGIIASLAAEWGNALFDYAAAEGPRWVFRLLLVALILFVFIQLSKLVQKGVERAMKSSRNRMSHLLSRMITSTVRNLIVILGVLIAISQLGISLAPLLAGLGIAGFIIGFALQDSLSNFASGVMILMYRPFDVGDVVDAAGVRGRVNHMSLVNTTFMTLDNQRLVVPNNMIWQSVITNVTAQRTRRVDLLFGISYGDDIEKAEEVLWDILNKHEDVLDDPEPIVKVHELGESSVNFAVRPWVRTTNYWDTYWDLTREVKLRFDKEGISIPFPQRDIHVIEKSPG